MGINKKEVVFTSNLLALVAEKTKVRKSKEKVVVDSGSDKSDDEDIKDLKKITTLLEKAFNRKKFYSKPTNNNLKTSSASTSANKKPEYVKQEEKKSDKKEHGKKRDMSRDQAWMESSSDLVQELSENMVFLAKMEKIIYDSEESLSSDKETLAEKYDVLQETYDVLNNEVNTFEDKSNKFDVQIKLLKEKNDDLLAHTKTLEEQLKVKNVVINTHIDCQAQYAKLDEHKQQYVIKFSSLVDNDRQHRQKIDAQEILYNKMSCFENPSDLCKAKELRPSPYDERVIGLRYTLMFLTHSDEPLEIEKFKRARENKIEFAYDYGNLNESYVNEKINFLNDYFQEIINLNFEKIDSPVQQTSSLKPEKKSEKNFEKIDSPVQQTNLEIIESIKSKGIESSESAISESENKSEKNVKWLKKVVAIWRVQTLHASYDMNDMYVFDDVNLSNSQVSKTPFRKKPRDSLNIVQICIWFLDSECSKHMTGNRALLTNFMEKFLGMVRFSNDDFAVISGYGDVVIRSIMIKKVYYFE
ncbi:hypothetical protein Tco_1254361, partial [Tanacetum coccineum]